MQTANVSAHAKIILIGEHAVVYGQPAISLPLKTIRTYACLKPSNNGQIIHSKLFDGDLQQVSDRLAGVKKLITTLLTRLATSNTPFDLTITSDIPVERGMGSSAATALAITKAFYTAFQQPLSEQILLTTAAISEKIVHGNPSGLDAATDNSQVPIYFIKNQCLRPLKLHVNGYLIVADTGIQGQTKEAVDAVQKLMQQQPTKTKQLITKLGQLTNAVVNMLANNQLVALGKAMNEAQVILKQLTVSSPALDKLVHVAQQYGALGSKLTGGGRGGCMISLTDTKSHAINIAQQLKQSGAKQTWIVPLENN